ncbi:MAG: hypothetical protein Ctma_1066 [Catillopecten margaritatus gill symbiont]|uniref:Uncharacterized protein n=1 Tax=Catillopecten margaritatus gill symbiont TaxID=3083288 RepID=A0AAU6PH75_9GAMM
MIEIILAIIPSVLIGIIASYVASKIFLYANNKKHKPNILISDKFIKSERKNDGTPSLKIKLINKTDQDLINIRIVVKGFENLSPSGSIPLISLHCIASRELMYIKKFDTNDKNAEYAHQSHLYITGDIQAEYLKYKTIRLSIIADCPYYNTSSIVTKDYTVATDILDENHRFNTGNSLSISS